MQKIYGLIYKITCLITNKIYIGKTTRSIKDRFRDHIYNATKKYKTYNSIPLYNAIKKYGKENFIIEQIAEATSLEELNNLEEYFIKELHAQDKKMGYNVVKGGNGGWENINSSLKKEKWNKENSIRMKKWWKNLSEEEYLEKCKQCGKITEKKKKSWEKRKGIPLSKKTCEKISIHSKNSRWYTNGTEETFSIICPNGWVKGRSYIFPKEVRQKISTSNKGKIHTLASKNKMSQSATGRRYYNDGKMNRLFHPGDIIPEGFVKGFLNTRDYSNRFGKKWWNNGKITVLAKECPGEGWISGRGKLK